MSDETSRENQQFDQQYAWYETETVISNRRIPLPAVVQNEIQNDNLVMGSSVTWGYAESADWMVLSQDELKNDDYQSVAYNEIEKPEGSTTYVRAPDDLPNRFLDMFFKGKPLVYLATHEMIDENPSTWLVEKPKLMTLLPGAGDDTEVKKMLSRNPGFLPRL
jgi:hypothetical protein